MLSYTQMNSTPCEKGRACVLWGESVESRSGGDPAAPERTARVLERP